VPITSIRTLTVNNEEVYARTHIQGVDGLSNSTENKDGLMSKEDKQKLNRLQEFDISKLNEATKISPGLMSMEDKQKLDSIDKHNQIINRNVNVYPNKTQIVNLNKNLTSCLNGIILVWRLDDIDDLYHYQYVPKYHNNHPNTYITEVIPYRNQSNKLDYCIKLVRVSNTQVVGAASNQLAPSNHVRLHEILEY